jgi:hypothetical protein
MANSGGMKSQPDPHYCRRFPAECISRAVCLHHVFSLSLRDVELLLAERSVVVSYETVRRWCKKLGHFAPMPLSRSGPFFEFGHQRRAKILRHWWKPIRAAQHMTKQERQTYGSVIMVLVVNVQRQLVAPMSCMVTAIQGAHRSSGWITIPVTLSRSPTAGSPPKPPCRRGTNRPECSRALPDAMPDCIGQSVRNSSRRRQSVCFDRRM